MTEVELFTELQTLGLPVAYGEFSSPVKPPFLAFQHSYTNYQVADNTNQISAENYQVELYTFEKNPTLEEKIEDLLTSLFLPFRKFEFLIKETEPNLRQIIYEFQLTN